MTLQEMIKSLDDLSVEEQTSLFDVLQLKLWEIKRKGKTINDQGDTFWDVTLRFRAKMQREEIEFTDEDFADLRDKSQSNSELRTQNSERPKPKVLGLK
jgi:hypothetical protein